MRCVVFSDLPHSGLDVVFQQHLRRKRVSNSMKHAVFAASVCAKRRELPNLPGHKWVRQAAPAAAADDRAFL